MGRLPQEGLTVRENQIINVLWDLEEATVEEIQQRLEADLAGSTLRTLLNVMEQKGYVEYYKKSHAKIFRPAIARENAQRSALKSLTERLFQGSANHLIARLVDDDEISLEELDQLRRQLRAKRKKGKRQ